MKENIFLKLMFSYGNKYKFKNTRLTFNGMVPLFEMDECVVLDLFNPFNLAEWFKTLPKMYVKRNV
jgi:hypothetical protein